MGKKFIILSIEDNLPDFELIQKALNKIQNVDLNIINIANGATALDFIYKKEDYKDSPTPDIILLDINLPTLNGKDILKKIKNDEKYKKIPVIIFSTSSLESDIEESYNLFANSYVIKTFDIKELFKKVANIGEYWLKTNETLKMRNYSTKNEDEKEIKT